jgi:hypothetical protein
MCWRRIAGTSGKRQGLEQSSVRSCEQQSSESETTRAPIAFCIATRGVRGSADFRTEFSTATTPRQSWSWPSCIRVVTQGVGSSAEDAEHGDEPGNRPVVPACGSGCTEILLTAGSWTSEWSSSRGTSFPAQWLAFARANDPPPPGSTPPSPPPHPRSRARTPQS